MILARLLTLHTTAALVCIALAMAGCATPCKNLSDQVCNCEPTEALQRACLQRVESDAGALDVTPVQEEVCAGLLEANACTCDALTNGDLAACGLARN